MAADQHTNPDIAALRKLEASVHVDLLEQAAVARGERWQHADLTPAQLGLTCWRLTALRFWSRWRRVSIGLGAAAGLVVVAMCALWWRLGSGPIDFDVATPWLAAAIEENFGSHHRIAVGGTQLERDANGRTALRIRDIVVRDAHGEIVASAPKAEVSFSGAGLMTGRVRANRLSLVGAEMQVRIEPDSRVTVFAGTNRQPFVTASASEPALRAGVVPDPASRERSVPAASRSTVPDLGSLLAWIDSLGAAGLDGRDLSELGLKNGNLTLFDQRNGKQWEFHDINLSLTRPGGGGVALTISSEAGERPWLLRAIVSREEGGVRTVEIETERLSAKDLLLALRIGDGQYEPNIPVSARVRASIGPDGIPKMIQGRIQLDKGYILDADDPLSRIDIDQARSSCSGMPRGRRWWRRSRSCPVATGLRCSLMSRRRAKAPPFGRSKSWVAALCWRHRRATRTRWFSIAFKWDCGSTPTSSASTSSRATSATAISVSRFRAASTIHRANRGLHWGLPEPACRSLP
jgi:hypothetical protein